MSEANKEINTGEMLMEDIILEEEFLKSLGDVKPAEMDTELTAMIKVYNEMLDYYVRDRFDSDIHRQLEKKEPSMTAHTTNRQAADKGRRDKRITISIIRNQILTLLSKDKN